jgi:type VI secretion system secreted protein VgrG
VGSTKRYQKRTVPVILRELFEVNHFVDYELCLSHDYRERDYCVQHRESDFHSGRPQRAI